MGGCVSSTKLAKARKDAPPEDPKAERQVQEEPRHADDAKRRSLGLLFYEDDELKPSKVGSTQQTTEVVPSVETKEVKEDYGEKSSSDREELVEVVDADKPITEQLKENNGQLGISEVIVQEGQYNIVGSSTRKEVSLVDCRIYEEEVTKLVDTDILKPENVEKSCSGGGEDSAKDAPPPSQERQLEEQPMLSADSGTPESSSTADRTMNIGLSERESSLSIPAITPSYKTIAVEVQEEAKDAKVDIKDTIENMEADGDKPITEQLIKTDGHLGISDVIVQEGQHSIVSSSAGEELPPVDGRIYEEEFTKTVDTDILKPKNVEKSCSGGGADSGKDVPPPSQESQLEEQPMLSADSGTPEISSTADQTMNIELSERVSSLAIPAITPASHTVVDEVQEEVGDVKVDVKDTIENLEK